MTQRPAGSGIPESSRPITTAASPCCARSGDDIACRWKMDGWYTAVTFQKTHPGRAGQVTPARRRRLLLHILDGRIGPTPRAASPCPRAPHLRRAGGQPGRAPGAAGFRRGAHDATWQATNMNGVWKTAGHWSLLADPAVTPSAWRLPPGPWPSPP